jgi:hypothetical protein
MPLGLGNSQFLSPPSIGQPAVTALPSLSGTPTHGNVLTSTQGTWTNSPSSYAYQWYSNNVLLPGATTNTYTLQLTDVGHYVICVVQASNAAGSSGAASLGTLVTS